MNPIQQQHFDFLYEQHLINLKLQGKRPATIDAYSRAIRRITTYFNRTPDTLTAQELKQYFNGLIQTHSWSTIKLDRNGLQFFYRYTLKKQPIQEPIRGKAKRRCPCCQHDMQYVGIIRLS